MQPPFNTTSYRYPNERLILVFTLTLVFLVILLSATATLCMSAVFVFGVVLLSYQSARATHLALIDRAYRITPQSMPELAGIAADTAGRLQARDLEIFIAHSNIPNAYTFGLVPPKIIVIHSILLKLMDKDELAFILGHEMGHVRLGHTWLNSLVGGMAGIPSSFGASALLVLAFRGWNRACEYSADRAGLLACGSLDKAVSALVKLVAGAGGRSLSGIEQAMARIEAEDDDFAGNLAELLGTHPMLVRRIDQLRKFAASEAYKRLQARLL
jgi:Zn-dependent protease with chaperone function